MANLPNDRPHPSKIYGKGTQERILDYLHDHPAVSITEISRALAMTRANIRHHIEILLAQERVTEAGKTQPPGRGRPMHVYRLSERAQLHNLDQLAGALLAEYLAGAESGVIDQALKRVATRIAGEPLPGARHLTQRLTASNRRLNELNYNAHWEAHADAPHVLFGHCPYAVMLKDHPELCRMDAFLLEHLLASPVHQTARRGDKNQSPYCVFLIQQG
jgi:predicted ArsR family transcriptional regulator